MDSSITKQCGPICSILPPFLLSDILEHDGCSQATRQAITKTLKHISKLHDRREERLVGISSAFQVAETDGAETALQEAKIPKEATKAVYREIYDSEKTDELRKILVHKEGRSPFPAKADVNAKEVHEYFGKSHSFFLEVFGRNSIDNKGLPLIGSVHFDDEPGPPGMDNAFWDGDEMAFGDGDGELIISFTSDLDIIGHELTHGVIQHTARLVYKFQSGALNESLADVFGSMIKQYHHPDGKQLAADADWLVGEGIFNPNLENARALRSLKAPGTAYNNPQIGQDRQPADMDSYAVLPDTSRGDWGGVHVNSGIPNRAFYLIATELGGYSWEKAGKVWYAAMSDPSLRGINPKSAFKIFADLTLKYALELFDQDVTDVVKKGWETVKVY